MRKVLVALGIIPLLLACKIVTPEPTKQGWLERCGPLPETFRESDLVGTWEVTREAGMSWDVIVFREDGTYKQMYQKSNGERYESPWNRWWLEHRSSGGVYVHLEGMRHCFSSMENCDRTEGGGGNGLFWDYCEDRVLEMRREVVLAVAESVEPDPLYGAAPRGIILLHMISDRDGIIRHFRLRE
jgi:hypothetical protein